MSEHIQSFESTEDISTPIENLSPEQEAQKCLAQIRDHARQTNDSDTLEGLQRQYRELQATMTKLEQGRVEACVQREGLRAEMELALLPPESVESKSETLIALESITTEYFSEIDIPGGDTQAGLDNMNLFFATLPESAQQEFLTLFQEIIEDDFALMDLEDYFMDNGFVNDETLGVFQTSLYGDYISEVVVDNQEVVVDNQEVVVDNQKIDTILLQKIRANHSKIDQLNETFTLMSEMNGIDGDLYDLYKSLDNFQISDISSLEEENINAYINSLDNFLILQYNAISTYFAELASQPEEFARVLDSLGGDENSELYQSVKAQVLSIPSSSGTLRTAFDAYENRGNPEYIPESVFPDTEPARLVTEGMNEGAAQGEALSEQYDHSTNPPRRTLSLGESDYQLEADLPIGENYPATVEYTNIVNEITPKIESISSVLDYIENIPDEVNISEVIGFIESNIDATILSDLLIIVGVDSLSSFNSVSALQSALVGPLGKKKQDLEQELESARLDYEEAKLAVQDAYKESLRERQEAQKEILLFLNQCGFDMIPKEITDMLIAEINRDYKGLSLGGGTILAENIDIKNGSLGDERNDGNDRFELGDKEKEGFIRLMNIMTTGKSEGQGTIVENPADSVTMNIPVVDTQVNNLLEENGVKSVATGSWNINEMRKHLQDYQNNLGTSK